MKKFITTSAICLCTLFASASIDGNTQTAAPDSPKDAPLAHFTADNIETPLSTSINSSDSAIIATAPASQVVYDGASYSFIFSWKKKKNLHPHWTGIGFSFLNYNKDDIPYGGLLRSKSYSVSLNLADYGIPIRNSNWLFVTGMGLDWSRFHFQDNAALTIVDGVTQFRPAPEGITYRSSKLLVYYVTIPLLMEYQLPTHKKNIYLSGGVVGFIKYYSKSQVNFNVDNRRVVENKGRDLNIRPIDLKLRLQMGIGDFSAFAYYSPISMFERNGGPDLNVYSIGIMMGF